MPLWRIRIRLSDDPHSRALLDQALAGHHVTELSFAPRDPQPEQPGQSAPQAREATAENPKATVAQMAGDVVLELPRDDDLEAMLSALHRISPQVFVSRVKDSSPAVSRPMVRIKQAGGVAGSAASSMAAAE